MCRLQTWSEAWACQQLGLNVSGEDTETNVIFDDERKRLCAVLPELEERKQLERASALPAHGLQLHPNPGMFRTSARMICLPHRTSSRRPARLPHLLSDTF